MTDCEIAVKKTVHAEASDMLAEIYKMKSESKTDSEILEAIISKLTSKTKET